MLSVINRIINLYLETFQLLGRGKAWLPLLILFVVQGFVLIAHLLFNHPIFYSVISFWTDFVGAEFSPAFTHYPGHFYLISYYFLHADLVVGFIIEGAFLGWISIYYYNYIFDETSDERTSFLQKFNLWFQLSLGWILINGLIVLSFRYLPTIMAPFLNGSPRREFVLEYLFIPGVATLVLAVFYFMISYIAVYKANIFIAAKQSFLLFLKHPLLITIMSFFIIVTPIVFTFVIKYQSDFMFRFNPEIMFWLLLGLLIISMPINLIWMGSAVLYLADEE